MRATYPLHAHTLPRPIGQHSHSITRCEHGEHFKGAHVSQHDEAIAALLGTDLTNVQIGRKVGCDEATVRRARKRLAEPGDTMADPADQRGKMDLDTGTGEGKFHNVTSDKPLTDWTHIFTKFNLDPAEFVIVDGTVQMSVWQQSKRLENGDRDVQNLYSYRARFRRVTEMDNLNLPALYAAELCGDDDREQDLHARQALRGRGKK